MKKLLSILLCMTLCVAITFQVMAWQGDPNLNPPGQLPICKEKVTLTIGIAGNPNVIDFENNRMTQMLEEDGNFELDFVTFTVKEMLEKLNVMVQTGGDDLPDVLIFGQKTRLKNTTLFNWALNGVVIPITDYVKNSSYFFTESMHASGTDLIPMLTMPDGEIYALPAYARSIGNEYQHKNWVYQPWLDKLGLTSPKNAEELYEVLKKFKEQDPNGNNKADEIPMISYYGDVKYLIRSLLSMFCDVGNFSDYVAVNDGKLYPVYITEEYREGLRYIRKLIDEDLLSALSFTQDEAQFKALMAQEPTVVGMGVRPSITTALPATDTRRAEYVGIPPFAMADGTVITPYTPTQAHPSFVITKNCKNPEAAYRLGDLICSEKYTVMTRWGEANVDWVKPEEGSIALYASMGYEPYLKETGNISWGSPQNQSWFCEGPYVRGYAIPAGMVWNGSPLDSEYRIAQIMPEYVGKGPKEYCANLIYTEEENNIIAEPLMIINSYVAECQAQFVTGGMDIDSDWEAYVNELKNNDLETVMKVMQGAYDRTR
jgi:putative aldouronate transport system substrate-binding protein